MKYEVTLMKTEFVKVGENYETVVKTTQKFVYDSYDDVQNLIGCMIEGSTTSVTFKVQKAAKEDE